MELLWVLLLVCLVNGLLLSATARFLNGSVSLQRILLGAITGGILTGVSLLPGAAFAKGFLWRLTVLLATGLLAFGTGRGVTGRLLLFALLHLSLGGISSTEGNLISMLLGAAGMYLACCTVRSRQAYIRVALPCGDRTLHITALRDTGNTLCDPVTGRSVLIVDQQSAMALTGLTRQQLMCPLKTLQEVSGLRLIPCRTVSASGFLLARRIPGARIGTWQGDALVAFSPQSFTGNYQALTGGRL